MASIFRASEPSDFDALAPFLLRILGLPSGTPGYSLPEMAWKYWSAHPEWDGSRSYLLESNGRIDAHCSVLPVTYMREGQRLRTVHFIDWAAEDAAFGAGMRILRRVARIVDRTFAVGGSPSTLKILPLAGFQPCGPVWSFALPVRPFRQALRHQYRNWKLLPRLGRNTWWYLRSSQSAPAGWTVKQCSPAEIPDALWGAKDGATLARERGRDLAAWYLACPMNPFRLHLISERGEPRAAFFLSFAPAQAHIADLWSYPGVPRDILYRLAVSAAMADPSVCEVTTAAFTPERASAIEASGFQRIDSRPMLSHPEAQPVDFQMLDNDACFLVSPTPVFLT